MVISSSIPRPEYPRPDRQRGQVEGIDWLNLNGPWQFRFDAERRGTDLRWFDPDGPEWREQIIVPFCWESLAAWGEGDAAGNDNYFSRRVFRDPSSVTRENHRSAARFEVGWYRRLVRIPDTDPWRGQRIILTVGAADYFIEAWCNGQSLGAQESGYVPVEYDLTDALVSRDGARYGLVVFRVEDPMDNHEQPVGKQWGWYTPTSGIWQTVFVEPRPASHIASFRIIPDIDHGHVNFDVTCRGGDDRAIVEVEILPPEAPPLKTTLVTRAGTARGLVKLFPVSLWDPASPKLYRVIFRLRQGEAPPDTVRGYFGMRKIHTAPAEGATRSPALLCLNNKPIYLRGALYQSYHPDGVYTARQLKTLQDDIAFAREAGFDFLRVHIKLDDPLLLHCADTAGMLLMQDFPNFGEGGDTPLGRQRFEAMMRRGFERDFNHPSIIAWCLFNESWGFGGQTELMKFIAPELGKRVSRKDAEKIANSSSFNWIHEMWQIAKTIDPSRLIEDMSVVVWEHVAAYGHVDTDINSWHFYIDDYEKARDHIAEVVAQTYRGSTYNYVTGREQNDVPLINSEYGGVGALDGDRDIGWTFKFLTNELRRYGQLSAYIFTQLTDVEWEYNGLLNYDRTPKQLGYPPTLINQGDVLPINAPPVSRVAPGSTVEVEVAASHFSRRPREGVTLHWQYSGIDTLGTIHPELARGWAPIPFTQYRVELARRLALTMPAEPMLCTLWVSAIASDGQVAASNFIKHYVSDGPIPLREERNRTLVLRQRVDQWSAAGWSGGQSTPEDARKFGRTSGQGTGYFSWRFTDEALRRVGEARRVRILCEASSNRGNTAQTDTYAAPTTCELSLNGLVIHAGVLPNHPHDTRGALSYLDDRFGAYGYLLRSAVEGEFLTRLAQSVEGDTLELRCAVPECAQPAGGLTIYGEAAGRYPVCPTLIIEWDQDEDRAAP